jgi:hypothetical protein
MKRNLLVSLILLAAMLFSSVPVFAAAPSGNTEKGPVDRLVFVHYPKKFAAKPPANSVKLTGVLCPDFKYAGIHWAQSGVTYSIDPTGSGVASASTVTAVQNSMATWNNAASGLTFTQVEPSSTLNNISWGSVSYTNAIAVTYISYLRSTKEITEVDTVMNNALPWSYYAFGPVALSGPAVPDANRYADPAPIPDNNRYDIQNIMTHEAGHWILLNDLYNTRDSLLTMYGYGDTGEICKDTLGYGDELGIETVYGP